MEIDRLAQRLFESTVGAENRSNEIERFNPQVETAVGTLAEAEVNLGVRLIGCFDCQTGGPLQDALPTVW